MSKLIGVFATEISSRVQGNLYMRMHKDASALGYNLVFFSANLERLNSDSTDKGAMDLFNIAERMDFAAFIIYAQSLRNNELINSIIDMGKRKDIPIFLYDCDAFGYTKDQGIITINLDYKQGFRDSVKHLIEVHNCKNIYMLAGVRDNKFSDDRIDAYKEEMAAHGYSVTQDNILYGDFWELPAVEAVNKLLDSNLPKPDAICCANDSMAIAAAKTLEQRGYKIPDDVRVTGFDGIEDGKYNFPAISTCEPILDVVPEFVFEAIKKGIRSEEFLVPLKFYPKESCGCVNEYATNDKVELARLMENMRQNSWQHSMLSNMQLQLMDSCNLDDSVGYMKGIMGIFKGFSHLFCIRDSIEILDDLTGEFDKMRVQLNMDFLPDEMCGAFSAKDVIPDCENVFYNAESDDIFIFRMIQSVVKKYGYSVTRAKVFSSNEVKIFGQFVESFTNTMESILRNRRLEQTQLKLSEMYERMSEIYVRDVMTGLYNRHGYYSKLDEYIARSDIRSGYIHVISVDMDGMKQINDNFGHQEGDNAIKAVAKAINDCFAQPCVSARFGGDEFVVSLFTDSPDRPSTEQISDRVNNYLKNIPMLQDKSYTVGVSVGHAISKVAEITEISMIEKMADDSMYENKRQRKAKRAQGNS